MSKIDEIQYIQFEKYIQRRKIFLLFTQSESIYKNFGRTGLQISNRVKINEYGKLNST